MRLLERYIFAEVLRVFAALVCVTTFLMVFVGVFGQIRDYGLGPWEIVQILPFVVPSLLPYTIPATLLLAVCVVYGRLSGDRELIAAKAAGIHVFTLLWPSYFLGALLSVVALLMIDQVIPWSNGNIDRIATLSMENIFLDLLRTQNQVYIKERGITITVLDVHDRTLIWPTFRYSPHGRNAVTIQAREAKLQFNLARQEVLLEMQHGYVDTPGGSRFYFESEKRAFPLMSKGQRLRAGNLRISDIHEQIAIARKEIEQARINQAATAAWILSTGNFERLAKPEFTGFKHKVNEARERTYRFNTEMHNRFAASCSCLFFVLLGSPFSMLMGRKQFLTSFLFCFAPILVVYYPVTVMTQNLSKTGQLDPAWAVWIANGLMAVAAGYFFRRVMQH